MWTPEHRPSRDRDLGRPGGDHTGRDAVYRRVRQAGAMAREIPEVVRAVAGLAATVLDEARKLPESLPGLPVRLIGQVLQTSLKLQQHYAGLVARGDELFTGLRGEAEPGLATFDDDLPEPPAAGTPAPRSSAFDRVGDLPTDTVAEELVETIAEGGDDLSPAEVAGLPDDPVADAVTAVEDELAAEVADEIATETPDSVPDEVLDDLAADTVAEAVADESALEEAAAFEAAFEAALEEA